MIPKRVKGVFINREGKIIIPLFEDEEPGIYKGLANYYNVEAKKRLFYDTLGNEVPEPPNYWVAYSNKATAPKNFSAEKIYPLAAKIGKYEYFGYVDSI